MAWRRFMSVAVVFCALVNSAHAQVYRWNNGQLIPGTSGVKPGPGVRLSGLDLRYADLSAGLDLSGADFQRSGLDYAHLQGANLANANLYHTHLETANLTGAVVTGTNFADAAWWGFTAAQLYSTQSYRAKNLSGIILSENNNKLGPLDLHDQNLTNARLSYTALTGANLAGAVVTGTEFSGSGITSAQLYSTQSYRVKDLQGIKLAEDDLSGWDFHEQNLANARLIGAKLTNANLTGANLANARLDSATLTNANLTGAVVTGTGFAMATSNGFTAAQLYSTQSYTSKDLHGIGLLDNDLTNWNLSGQNLTNAYLLDSTLTNANLAAADIRGAWVTGLAGAILKNTILPHGQLNGLNLTGGEQLVVRNYHGNPDQGLSKIPVKINSGLTIGTGGLLSLQFDGQPWDSPIKFQPGVPVQLGGALELKFTDDTQLASQAGRAIQVFDWTGVTPQGEFAVQAQPGTAWDTSRLYTTGEVTLLGISSDLDADKDVDATDLTDFLKNWTGSEYPVADKTWQDGDSDHDGDVDSADVLVFLSQWTGAAEVSGVVSVPEPGGVAVGWLLAPALMHCVRRRSRR